MALPTPEVVAAWAYHDAALEWSEATAVVFGAAAAPLGGPLTWQDLAICPPAALREAVAVARMEDARLAPLQAAQVGRLWRVARRAADLASGDPLDGGER